MEIFANGYAAAVGFGFVYFLAAIPAGVALGVPVLVAGFLAWVGYSAGALVIVLAGAPARGWVVKRFRLSIERDPSKLVWRIWDRGGMVGLGLVAPVTVGPQIGAVLALAIGEPAWRVVACLSFGVVPWCVAFGLLTGFGVRIIS